MRPMIGITMNLDIQQTRNMNSIDQDYGRAVYQAGGLPVPLVGLDSAIPDLVKRLDGFLFTGGDDINPAFYKEKPASGANLSLAPRERTMFEINLFKAASKAKKPVLAVCYGAQLVNVALGGKLYQDINLQVTNPIKHGPSRAGEIVHHAVDIFEGTLLARIMGVPQIKVRSAHHQSVKNPGRGLHLSAVAHDRVIEALEARSRTFLLAVQWHPEKAPHDRHTKRLFKAFVNAAKK